MRVTRWDIFLVILLVLSCISVILSRYHARKAYFSITQQQEIARNLDVRFGQLQLEESTDSMRFQLQQVAHKRLGLVTPKKVYTIQLTHAVGTS